VLSQLILLTACGGGGDGGSSADGSSSTMATSASTTNGTGGGSPGVSYQADVRPIFLERCTYCHHPNAALPVNIADPFDPETGLVGSENTWANAHPEDNPEQFNVVPFEPENSFLMRKISDPNIDPTVSGAFMPWDIPPLTAQEIQTRRQWITDGANDDELYQTQVRLIFGDGMSLATAGGKCGYCHHPTGLKPDLTNPFDSTNGAVGVASPTFAGEIRIVPGSPDDSLLIKKVEATAASTEIGAPMPRHYDPLTATEVETVRQWIAEGAQNN
jgi:hypothetical protein